MKLLFCTLIGLLFVTGCKSVEQLTILPTYSYEGVYSHNAVITIDGVAIDRTTDKERVWIISDKTLTYILYDAKHHIYKNKK